jgi:hypothetical protein
MDEDRLEELIEEAEGGDISPSEYRSAVEDLDVERSEEAFLKATGMALISRGRAEEVRDMSEALLSEKYRTDDVFETVLEELDGMEEVYSDHMEDLEEKFSYSAEVWKEVEENLREAGGDVYVDIDIHVEGDTIHNLHELDEGTEGGSDTKEILTTKRGLGRKLMGTGIAALLGGAVYSGATGRDRIEIAEENIGGDPLDYDTEISRDETIEAFVEDLSGMEFYGETFREVDESLEGDEDMGFLDAEGRIDFYDDEIKSSVVMSEDVYERAIGEL